MTGYLAFPAAAARVDVRSPVREPPPVPGGTAARGARPQPMPELTLIEAVNLALGPCDGRTTSVVVLGEDVGVNGGVFRATAGLAQRFGAERVLDTPLPETLIAGMAIGMAAAGLQAGRRDPVHGLHLPGPRPALNHAARLRNRTRGRLTCPLVLRTPHGGGIHAPEHHSESTEALFTHIPGLRVVIPSSPARAYGLLLAAIRDPDPVLFLEPTRLYRLAREVVEDDGSALPLDTCFVLREGPDVTLVSWGAMLHETLAAADALSATGSAARSSMWRRSSRSTSTPSWTR